MGVAQKIIEPGTEREGRKNIQPINIQHSGKIQIPTFKKLTAAENDCDSTSAFGTDATTPSELTCSCWGLPRVARGLATLGFEAQSLWD